MGLSNGLYIKKQLFLQKKATFLQKYIFVKMQFFDNRLICKKAALLHKKATFLQKYIFVKKQYFYNQVTCKKAAFIYIYTSGLLAMLCSAW